MKFVRTVRYAPARRSPPLAGAWIEIFSAGLSTLQPLSPPLAGAWIEILAVGAEVVRLAGRPPSRGRGLKSG